MPCPYWEYRQGGVISKPTTDYGRIITHSFLIGKYELRKNFFMDERTFWEGKDA